MVVVARIEVTALRRIVFHVGYQPFPVVMITPGAES